MDALMWKLVLITCAMLVAACAAPSEDARTDTAATWSSSTCGPDAMLPGASGARKKILQRAAVWVNDPLPYSMTDWHDGYRQDCSGFVGMAWAVSGNMTTAALPPQDDGGGYAKEIDWDDLQPGDAIARGPNGWSNVGHVRLYAGRSSSGEMCFWEQTMGVFSAGGTEVNWYSRDGAESQGFVPIKKRGLWPR